MNEVSIIINGVRYDAVEGDSESKTGCRCCDLHDMCRAHCEYQLCEYLGITLFWYFKKSDKKFER